VPLVLSGGGALEDMLDNEEQLAEQLDALPYLVRGQGVTVEGLGPCSCGHIVVVANLRLIMLSDVMPRSNWSYMAAN
jgi:hypothetical protein